MTTGGTSPVRPVEMEGSQGRLAGFLHVPRGWPEAPCVILCHGLFSSMESPKFRVLAEELRRTGLAALRFDFAGCGSSEGDLRRTTVSGRVEDLQRVIHSLREDLGHIGPMGLMGSSMGGFVCLLALGERSDVSAACVWATPFAPRELVALRGHRETRELDETFFKDLTNHSLGSIASKIHHLLVIHGEEDELVPAQDAFRINDIASEPKQVSLIPGADHRFTDPAHRDQAMRMTLEWFSIHLGPHRALTR